MAYIKISKLRGPLRGAENINTQMCNIELFGYFCYYLLKHKTKRVYVTILYVQIQLVDWWSASYGQDLSNFHTKWGK